jgi:ketosteroid isomerase-like protein
MKIRLLLALVGFGIGFPVPTLAQQANTQDSQLRQVIDALTKKTDEAYNNGDAASMAALYTVDAVLVTDAGPIYGREAIEKHYANLFQRIHFINHLSKADENSPHIVGTAGNETWSNGKWSQTIKGQNFGPIQLKGYWSSITVREGDTWKKRLDIWNITYSFGP